MQTDITNIPIDVIVNAANNELKRGGGVCGSIFQAAGPGLDLACATIGGCATGDAVLTGSFSHTRAKAIVHAVGPQVIGQLTDEHRQHLESCYTRSLDVAAQNGLTSIVCVFQKYSITCYFQAFPCISTAIYRFPNQEAADIALRAVNQWLQSNRNTCKVFFIGKAIVCTNSSSGVAHRLLHFREQGPRHLQGAFAEPLSQLRRRNCTGSHPRARSSTQG